MREMSDNQSGIIIKVNSFGELGRRIREMGLVPGGTYRNREFRVNQVDVDQKVSPYLMDVLFDPQTSGGLLMAVPQERTGEMLKRLKEKGIEEAAIIGEVVNDPRERIVVTKND